MRYIQWTRTRAGRLLAILLGALIYLLLLTIDGLRFFPYETSHHVSLLLAWMSFGFSAFVALLFLAVGALVWLYARERRVALLLLAFSFTMMMSFAVEAGAALIGDPLLSLIGGMSSGLAVLLFSILLLLFPKNYFLSPIQRSSVPNNRSKSSRQHLYALLLRGYLAVLILLSTTVLLQAVFRYLQSSQVSDVLNLFANSYYVLALIGILASIIALYRRSPSLRERQQLRFFVIGVFLAFAPLLILTVLPLLLNLPGVDGRWTTITLILLPLALGYSILRYQGREAIKSM